MFPTVIKEIKELLTDKKILIGILLVLIILIIGTSYNVQNTSKPASDQLTLGVINKDDSAYSGLFLNYFKSSNTFSSFVTVEMGKEVDINNAFIQGKLDVIMVIPKDFAANMMVLNHSPINITLNTSDTTKAILFKNVLKSYEKYITAVEANAVGLYEIMKAEKMAADLIESTNQTVSIHLIMTALGREAFFDYKSVSQFPVTTMAMYYIASILVMTALYFGLYIGYQVLNEMKLGTFTRICTTKTSLYQFLNAKMLVVIGILTLLVTTAIIMLCQRSFSLELFLFSLAVAMLSVCLAVFLCAMFRTTQRFILAGNLIIFYFVVIGGGIIPIQFLPQDMLRLSEFTPYFYILKGILNINMGHDWKAEGTTIVFFLLSISLYMISLIILKRRSVINDEA